jgi:hypothetical protein
VPDGMSLIADRPQDRHAQSGGRAGHIMEAFKPGTGPADSYWVIGMDELVEGGGEGLSPAASQAISIPAAVVSTEAPACSFPACFRFLSAQARHWVLF